MTFNLRSTFDICRKHFAAHFLASILAASVATQAFAQVREWRNPSGGSYHSTANWTPADAPNTAAETALFDLSSSYAVSFFAGDAVTVGGLVVNDGRVFFEAPGTATYMVSGSTEVRASDFVLFESAAAGRIDLIGQHAFVTDDGRLTFDGGSQSVIDGLFVGDTGANNVGEVRVLGGSSLKLRSGEELSLGGQTSGTSRLTVSGTDSVLEAEFNNDIGIGTNGTGIMEVLSRGLVKAPLANVAIGQSAVGFGSRLTLNGDSTFTTVDPGIGHGFTGVRSAGTAEVLGGSLFEPGTLVVQSDSTALVSGSGSILRLHGNLGIQDTSSVTVQSGARAELLRGGGSAITGRASLTVTGPGTRLVGDDVITVIGDNGNFPARVHVLNGAVIEPDTPGNAIEFLMSDGHTEMVVDGTNSAYHADAASLRIGTGANSVGSLRVSNGGRVTLGQLFVGTSASASGTVDLDAGTLVISGPAGFSSAAGGAAVVNVLPSSLLQFDDQVTLGSGALLNLYGGELRLADLAELTDQGGSVNWNNGTVRVNGQATLTPAASGLLLPGGTLGFGQTMHVAGNLTLQTTITLDGGTLVVQGLTNNSLLQLQSGTFRWLGELHVDETIGPLGGTLDLGPNMTIKADQGIANVGLITGDGTLDGGLSNDGGTVRVEAGISLNFTGSASQANNGQIQILGGRIDFSGELTNGPQGFISGRGTLAVEDIWNNAGTAAFSAGFTDVFGDVENFAAGTIIATGGATVTFYGDVDHNGAEIRTAANSSTVFLGDVTGAGPFTGTGTNYFEGDVAPGNSAAAVKVAGDVVFGATAQLAIELGGTAPGTEFDVLDIAGSVSLDGALDVSLINGFEPAAGDAFDVLDWSSVSGTFDALNLPALVGLEWDTSQLYTDGLLAVVAPGLTGDYNADGSVDAADYVMWRKTDGTPAGYDTWRANFGATAGGASLGRTGGVDNVPEPTSALLAMVALSNVLTFRRRAISSAIWCDLL